MVVEVEVELVVVVVAAKVVLGATAAVENINGVEYARVNGGCARACPCPRVRSSGGCTCDGGGGNAGSLADIVPTQLSLSLRLSSFSFPPLELSPLRLLLVLSALSPVAAAETLAAALLRLRLALPRLAPALATPPLLPLPALPRPAARLAPATIGRRLTWCCCWARLRLRLLVVDLYEVEGSFVAGCWRCSWCCSWRS